MTVLEGDELQRLWSLVAELSSQLSSNREQCLALQQQADELKGQALHAGTGYTLRRFNLDISKEKFESGLERINAGLVLENQSLAHENRQLNLLLREYEQTLEGVMSRFRSFSHATQQHTLQLTQHYESLLAQRVEEEERQSLHESTATSVQLSQLGDLVRLALRSLEGEDVPEPGNSSSPTGSASTTAAYGSAPAADPRWYGTGGYTGPAGDPDAAGSAQALAFATEEARLRFENEQLRLLLGVATEPPEPTPPQPPPTIAQLSLGKPRVGKKAAAAAAAEAAALEAEEARMDKDSDEDSEEGDAERLAESALDDADAGSAEPTLAEAPVAQQQEEETQEELQSEGAEKESLSYAEVASSEASSATTEETSTATAAAATVEEASAPSSSLLLSTTPLEADVEAGSSGASDSSGSDSGSSVSSAATTDEGDASVDAPPAEDMLGLQLEQKPTLAEAKADEAEDVRTATPLLAEDKSSAAPVAEEKTDAAASSAEEGQTEEVAL